MNTSTTQQQYGDPAPVSGGHQVALAAFRGHRYVTGEGGAAPTGNVEGATTDNDTQQGASAAATTPPVETTPPATTPPTPAAPTPATVAAQQQSKPQETFSRDYVQELREEAKNNRIAHQEAEKRATTAEAQLATVQAQLAQYQRDSVVRAAAKDIANPDLLLDSSSFTQTLAEVNLDDPEAVKAAITAFVEQNSAYGPTTNLPGTSGGTPTGGTENKPTTLAGAIAARLQQ